MAEHFVALLAAQLLALVAQQLRDAVPCDDSRASAVRAGRIREKREDEIVLAQKLAVAKPRDGAGDARQQLAAQTFRVRFEPSGFLPFET